MSNILELLEFGARRGVFPGAVASAYHRGRRLFLLSAGLRQKFPSEEPNSPDTIYDLASLTKPMAAATVAMVGVEQGWLDVEQPVQWLLPEFRGPGKAVVRVRHLLAHTSGLPAWRPYLASLRARRPDLALGSQEARELVYGWAAAEPLEAEPGKRAVYSDIGFILLGWLLERNAGARLDALFRNFVANRFGLGDVFFLPYRDGGTEVAAGLATRIAPTDTCRDRGRLLRGEVNDAACAALGGVSGHAGLFGTADEVARWAVALLDASSGGGYCLRKETVQLFWRHDPGVAGSTWRLGWDSPTPGASSGGKHLSAEAVGHLGFTGCSLWIDPRRDLVMVLLTNRVHPTGENEMIKKFRPVFHDLIVESLGG
jgi:CubicO group peptidase (beta-lactamase class C family)